MSNSPTPLPENIVLSVIIPVFNEIKTIRAILERVQRAPYDKQIIVVDDGSTDGSAELLRELYDSTNLIDRLVLQGKNQGKGAALRAGFAEVTGQVAIIQDADLEYDPFEYPKLVAPVVDGRADVVYGSRFMTTEAHRVLFFWHSIANRLLTLLSNMLTNLNLTDMETCYKVFRYEVVQQLDVQENGFGVEPEMTAKIAALDCRIFEVGISYDGRKYDEGKKINWKDAVWALVCIVRYRFFKKRRKIDWSLTPKRQEQKDSVREES